MQNKIGSHLFLKHVMEFEHQLQKAERVRVYAKVGCPTHFRNASEILLEEFDEEWKKLRKHLNDHGVDLDACSPNVTSRDLYKFTIEELFFHEIENIAMNGITTCFIYDEFHPDFVYENTRIALDDCIHYLFDQNSFFDHHYADRIQLNQYTNLSKSELKQIVSNFKKKFDQVMPIHLGAVDCKINNSNCIVKGLYEIVFMLRGKSLIKKGNWTVQFTYNNSTGYWDIINVQLSGIEIFSML